VPGIAGFRWETDNPSVEVLDSEKSGRELTKRIDGSGSMSI
jgi:hypothetical protein